MSLKDKIAIALIVIVLVVFGFILNALAISGINVGDYDGNGRSNMKDLALMAYKDQNKFFNYSISSLKNQYIAQNGYAINYKSAMCMYHKQASSSWSDADKYKISDILDFDYNATTGYTLKTNGALYTNTGKYTWAFLKSFSEAFLTLADYNASYPIAKDRSIAYFKLAISNNQIQVNPRFYNNTEVIDYSDFLDASYTDYGTEVANYRPINKATTSPVVSKDGTYVIIGPLKANYGGKNIKNVQLSKGVLGTGSTTYVNGGKLSWSASATGGTWSTSLTSIPSGANFYLRIKETDFSISGESRINVKINQDSIVYYKARIIFLYKEIADAQSIAIYSAKKDTKSASATWAITDIEDGFDLTINKKNEKNENVKDAGFKLYVDGKGWLKGTSGSYTYDANIANGTKYTTTASGKITLGGLSVDDEYQVYEVSVPAGYLQLDKQITGGMTAKIGSTTVTPVYEAGKGIKCGTVTSTTGNDVELTATNKAYTELKINKKNEKNENVLGAEFKIKVYDGATVKGWLNGTSSYTFKSNMSDGTKYTTTATGEIKLEKLPVGYTYEVYEVGVPAKYVTLDKQIAAGMTVNGNTLNSSAYNATTRAINCGKFSSTTGSTVTLNVKNIAYTKLVISKVNELGAPANNVGFKIRVYDGAAAKGWLKGTSSYTYESNIANGQEYKTSSGKITLNYLPAGYSYEVYETSVPSGYLPLQYQIGAGMKVNGNPLNSSAYNATTGIKCGKFSRVDTNDITINISNTQNYVDLVIKKTNELGANVAGAEFKVKVYDGATAKGWLSYNSSTYTYKYDNSSISNGQKWTTTTGGVTIPALSQEYTYEIYEISVPSGYLPIEYQIGAGMTVNGNRLNFSAFDATNRIINCGKFTGTPGSHTVNVNVTNTKSYTEITIDKVDEIGSSLNTGGAIFKIYVEGKGWLSYDSSTYTYKYDNSSISNATEWKTEDSEKLEITALSTRYNYIIYETKQSDNFLSLEEQIVAGMTVKIGGTSVTPVLETGKGIKCGKVTSTHGTTTEVEIRIVNIEDYLNISGMIWEDHVGTKSDDYDSKYDSSSADALYTKNVRISLRNASGTEVSSTTTNTGIYTFEKPITVASTMNNTHIKNKLNGYYLMFEYDSEYSEEQDPATHVGTISYYATVEPNKANENGSKALPKKGGATEEVFKNNPVKTYIYKLSDYVDAPKDCYNEGTHTLEYMNMGLVNMKDSYDFDINQVIDHVKVAINGYTYTYRYGEPGIEDISAGPVVRWDNGWAYTRPIYPSDIAYSNEIGWEDARALKVYVVYRIDIQDGTINEYDGRPKSSITGTKQVSYVEKSLKVESLINNYDARRYELVGSNSISTHADFDKWNNVGGVAKYTGNKFDSEIPIGETRSVYVQFKVKGNALRTLLEESQAAAEENPTVAKAEAYHNFWKSYNAWDGTTRTLVKPDLRTAVAEKEADAISLILELGTERQIKGKVFEDNIIDMATGEELGNGKYDSDENVVGDTKVELLLGDQSTVANIYPSNESYAEKPASTTSATNGEYTITGMVPGKYYVRFTYGDGTQKIFKTDGTVVGVATLDDYKSTTIHENCIKQALGYDGATGSEEWYKHMSHSSDADNVNYSTAVDDLDQRADYNQHPDSTKVVGAHTALMDISIENDPESDDIATIDRFDDPQVREEILGVNFGIIKHPDVQIDVDKVVNHIKITNTQGNIIAEGNPRTQNIPYVSNLDVDDHIVDGSTYVKAEISEEELYGSTLELKYAITVRNNSAVNYYEEESDPHHGYYYWFGDNGEGAGEVNTNAIEVTVTIKEISDYIDQSVKSDNLVMLDHTLNIDNSSDVFTNAETGESVEYDFIAKIEGWGVLYTTENPDRATDGKTTQETANYIASRLLSTEDDDMYVDNIAQVTDLEITNTPRLVEPIDESSKYFGEYFRNPTREVFVTITPPTGADRITPIIYIVASVLAGITLVGGIILIKKKVLDK